MRPNTLRKRRDILPVGMVTPAMVITLLVVFLPMFRTITYSFMSYILYKPAEIQYHGFANYKMLFSDPLFYTSLKNTIIWIVGIILFQFLLGFATALL